MTIWRMLVREIARGKVNFGLALLSMAAAVGAFAAALTSLEAHDLRTAEILAQREAELRTRLAGMEEEVTRAMTGLGFDILIIPRDQDLTDWHADNYASKFMPQEYAGRLAAARLFTVGNIVPRLRQKINWPETKWTVILVGGGGLPSDLADGALPAGSVILGHEIHRGMNLQAGARVQVMGNEFSVCGCDRERGSHDDITIWMNLEDAQKLLEKEGLINEILAVQCRAALRNLPKIREEVSGILPDTQVLEKSSHTLAKAAAFQQVECEGKTAIEKEVESRRRLRSGQMRVNVILSGLISVISAAWLALLSLSNVKAREREIGILRVLGYGGGSILILLMARLVLLAVGGAVLGLFAGRFGLLAAGASGTLQRGAGIPWVPSGHAWGALFLVGAVMLLAGAIPVVIAARRDAADVLREG